MDAKIKEMIMKRQSANVEILQMIGDAVMKYPDLRFGQILVNIGVVQLIQDPASFDIIGARDPFHEESVATLNRMKEKR